MPQGMEFGGEVLAFGIELGACYTQNNQLIIKQFDGFQMQPVTLKQFFTDLDSALNSTLNHTSSIKLGIEASKIKDAFPGMDNITVELKKLYVYIPDVTKSTSVEYALWIQVKGLAQAFPVKFKRAYLKLWNTTDTAIKDTLNIQDLQ